MFTRESAISLVLFSDPLTGDGVLHGTESYPDRELSTPRPDTPQRGSKGESTYLGYCEEATIIRGRACSPGQIRGYWIGAVLGVDFRERGTGELRTTPNSRRSQNARSPNFD